LKISQSFENPEAVVKFTLLSRLAVKAIEVAGAGAVSALCAYLLGQFERHPAPAPVPVPAVIQISPVTADNRAGAEPVGVTNFARPEVDSEPQRVANAPASTAAPKVAKQVPTTPAGRNQKLEQSARAELKARTAEPLATQPGSLASNSAGKPAAQTVRPATGGDQPGAGNGGEEERPLVAKLTSWFLPENDRVFGDLPRPPMPVGDFLRRAM
jgi:hypothetical protein